MNTYTIAWQNGHYTNATNLQAATPGQAKYAFYLSMSDCCPDATFKDILKRIISCRKLASFNPSYLFGEQVAFEQMKLHRDIPFAYIGMRVEVRGKMGTLIGNHGDNLLVCFDGTHWSRNCHPGYQTKYFAQDGTLLMDNTQPDISKCGDCRHLARCSRLLNIAETTVGCDFSPTKFQPKRREPVSCSL